MIVFIWMILLVSPAFATTRYVDTTLGSACTTGNYSISSRSCTGTDGNAYQTIAAGITPTVAGDTLYLRCATYPTDQRIDLQLENKSGASGAYIKIAGYPGECKPVIQYAEACCNLYGNIKARGARGWFIFEDLILDGVNLGNGSGWQIRDGNNNFIIRRLEIKNHAFNGIYFESDTVTVEDTYIHDARTDCLVGNRWHGFYVHHGTNIVLQRNRVEHMPGIGAQVFPGPWDGVTIKDNIFYGNNHCTTVNNGGFVLYASGGNISNVNIFNNVIAHNGYSYGAFPGGAGGGIRILRSTYNFVNTNIYNNTVVDNTYNPSACTSTPCPDHEQGNAISILSGVTGVDIKNNILTDNTSASVVNYGTVTLSYNACKSSESCGTTGKVTVSASTDCIISLSTPDYTLQRTSNPCVDTGTAVSTRPSPVNATDVGAYEMGIVAAANAGASGGIEVQFIVGSSGLSPSSGITGMSVTCVGCTGSPTVTAANVKPGSETTVQLTLAGITVAGSCKITLSSNSNLTDTGFIATAPVTAQPVRGESLLTVNGTCQNSTSSSVTISWSKFQLDEGSGTVATDSSGNLHNGTVSAGVTWVNNTSGTGVTIPADATYRQIASTFGSGVNPTTQDFAKCVVVLPDTQYSQKVVFSSSSNGTAQRWYAGWSTVGGQLQWGIGIQGSGFTTGSSFPVTSQKTFLCLVNDSTADTATLWVGKVKGTGVGTSVKSFTSYTLTGNLVTGNDGTNTVNNGGFTVYEDYTWNTKPSDADISALYDSLFPTGTTAPCYSQVAHQARLVYLDTSGAPIPYGAVLSDIEVIDGGAVNIAYQFDCGGTNGAPVAFVPRYSKDGSTFSLTIPGSLGADGIAMWGDSSLSTLNRFTVTCCLQAGLAPNNGVTLLTSTTSPTIQLAQNNSYTLAIMVRFASGLVGQSFWIKWYQDNGQPLSGTYTPSNGSKITIVPNRSTGVF